MHGAGRFNIEHMDSKCTFFITETLKTTRKIFHQSPIEWRSYLDNEKIHVIKTLHDYTDKTKNLRTAGQLIISCKKLHLPVSKSTMARWCKNIMEKTGIDIESYSSHSTDLLPLAKLKWGTINDRN